MKKNLIFYSTLILICLFLYSNVSAQTEKLTNKEIISMTKVELGEEIILKKILTSQTDFDLSADSLIELKQANVSDEIIEAMLKAKFGISDDKKPTAKNAQTPQQQNYGIYLFENLNGEKRLTQLMPNVSVQNSVGDNFSSVFVSLGLGRVETKAKLSRKTADLQIPYSRPVFHFYLDTKSGGLNTTSGIPSSPREIYLIKFKTRKGKREIAVTQETTDFAKSGFHDKYLIDFDFVYLGKGIYEVSPKKPLDRGEYAFYLANAVNSNFSSGIGLKFFDFGIRGN